MMRAGKLRHRILFQSPAAGQEDAAGQESTDWVDGFSVAADIEPLSGRQLLAAQAEQSSVTHKVTLRYRDELAVPAVVAAMRILYGTRIFQIHVSLNEDERNRQITLMVEEGLTHE